MLRSQNPKSSNWVELCLGAAPLAQQHLLSCPGRHGDRRAQFASYFEIRAMTQFVTFGKQPQLQLEDPDEESRKTLSATAEYYQREGRVAVSESRGFIQCQKCQNKHGWQPLQSLSPFARENSSSGMVTPVTSLFVTVMAGLSACLLLGLPSGV